MLTPRLETIASKVGKGARVIDVGTDHAYIPIYLVKEGIVSTALAADINAGPLARAEDNIKEQGLEGKIKTFLTNGLLNIDTQNYDTVIIAGMGGILISEIMQQTDNSELTFILQPMTAAEELRRYLYENSFVITDEELVAEGQKMYTVLVARKGEGQSYEEHELYIGKKLFEKKDPLFLEFIQRLKNKLEVIINGLEKSADRKNIDYYRNLLKRIEATSNDYKN